MKKESAYPNPRQQPGPTPETRYAPTTPSYSIPVPKQPSLWDAMKGGFDSVQQYKSPLGHGMTQMGLQSQEWADTKLTREQWLEKYPGTGPRDYYEWRESLRRRKKPRQQNWLQKAIWPLNKLIQR